MTEKYILTGKVQFGRQYQITDSETNYAYKNNKSDKQKICDLLNKLTDENEVLTQGILIKEEIINDLKDDINKCNIQCRKLGNENEQLKSELGKLNILYKSKCKTEEQLLEMGKEVEKENEQLKSENNMLKVTIGRNEAYIKRLTETSEWRC